MSEMEETLLEQEGNATFEWKLQMNRRPKKPLELMHHQLGHRSSTAILLADKEMMYSDIAIEAPVEDFCETCHISTIRATSRGGPKDVDHITEPEQAFYMDIQPNPARQALGSFEFYPNYLTITDVKSRRYRMVGLHETTTSNVLDAFKECITQDPPYPGYTFEEHCSEIHVDAGKQLCSAEFKQWCVQQKIKHITAGVAHQEMNGLSERFWQACHKIAFSMLNEARLGWAYLHRAFLYACDVMDVLPVKGCTKRVHGMKRQVCPKMAWHRDATTTNVGKYRVFGCPVVAKVYRRTDFPDENGKRSLLTSKNIIQRGVQGIFVGFPANQASWNVYVPYTNQVLPSCDVAFDEYFTSVGLAHNK